MADLYAPISLIVVPILWPNSSLEGCSISCTPKLEGCSISCTSKVRTTCSAQDCLAKTLSLQQPSDQTACQWARAPRASRANKGRNPSSAGAVGIRIVGGGLATLPSASRRLHARGGPAGEASRDGSLEAQRATGPSPRTLRACLLSAYLSPTLPLFAS